MGKYFGTDGIRGKANSHPITAEMALNVGRAVTCHFRETSDEPTVVVAKDTRISGDMIVSAIIAGICSKGGNAVYAGILPTPALPVMIAETGAAAGIMISASHNPYYDNGIKLFGKSGHKLSDEVESSIEALIDHCDIGNCSDSEIGVMHLDERNSLESYLAFLKKAMPPDFDLTGFHVVLDCSNGATYKAAPEIFARFGAKVSVICAKPDGYNINDGCGSQHTGMLSEKVRETCAHAGLAFDGDGDRLISVDEKGDVLTGDQLLVIFADFLKKRGKLKNNTVVATVMSNLGFKKAMDALDIVCRITDVGDRYVYEEMNKAGAVLGGEDSGHIIFLNRHTTGDGILSGLMLMNAIRYEKKPLSEMKKMRIFPQKIKNVDVTEKKPIETIPGLMEAIREAEKALGKNGRVYVRYSGTQNLLRIMVEAPTEEETILICDDIARLVKTAL